LDIDRQSTLDVLAPESMVAMTISNLVRNAVQHGTGPEVHCQSRGRELVVSNSGALPAGDMSNPPKRFTTHPSGHGMGLYLVRRICERYGWSISLENTAIGVKATVVF
jgi:signal transduction histidine kinase